MTWLAGAGLVEGGDPELVLLSLGQSLGRPPAPVALDLPALLPLHVSPGPLLDDVPVSVSGVGFKFLNLNQIQIFDQWLSFIPRDGSAAVVDRLLPLEVHVVLAPVCDVRRRGRHRGPERVFGGDGFQGLQVVRLPLGVDRPDPELVLVTGLEAVDVNVACGRGADRRPDSSVLGVNSML